MVNSDSQDGKGQDSQDTKTLTDEEFERLKDAMSSGDVKQGHNNGSDIETIHLTSLNWAKLSLWSDARKVTSKARASKSFT